MSGAVVVVGAGSGIGRALATALARRDATLLLAGRDLADLQRQAGDLALRYGVTARAVAFDALAGESAEVFLDRCEASAGGALAGLAWCVGEMPDEDEMRRSPALFERMVRLNYLSAVPVLEVAGDRLARSGGGWICGIGSVAGDRGRPKNRLYGSAKAAFATHLSGLRSRLAARGVAVVSVKPGFVDTRMTWGRTRSRLLASPDRVARDVLRGIDRNRAVVYTPGFWRVVMAIIRAIPDPVFRRLDF